MTEVYPPNALATHQLTLCGLTCSCIFPSIRCPCIQICSIIRIIYCIQSLYSEPLLSYAEHIYNNWQRTRHVTQTHAGKLFLTNFVFNMKHNIITRLTWYATWARLHKPRIVCAILTLPVFVVEQRISYIACTTISSESCHRSASI